MTLTYCVWKGVVDCENVMLTAVFSLPGSRGKCSASDLIPMECCEGFEIYNLSILQAYLADIRSGLRCHNLQNVCRGFLECNQCGMWRILESSHGRLTDLVSHECWNLPCQYAANVPFSLLGSFVCSLLGANASPCRLWNCSR